MELAVIVQHTQGVSSHLLSGKEFRGGICEAGAQLQTFVIHFGTEFVVGQEQATLGTRGGTAGIEKLGWGSGGVAIEKHQELLLDVPEIPLRFFGDQERAEIPPRGGAPTITSSPYAGDQLIVDHIVPQSVATQLDKVIANLELMPLRMNQSKKDAMDE